MAREIRARIGVARLLLQPLVGQQSHAAASRTQAAALIDLVRIATLPVADRATFSELALGVAWHGVDGALVADAFVPSVTRTRNQMQNYETLHEFFPAVEWERLLNAEVGVTEKLSVVINRLVLLGCRAPSEPTFKYITSMLLVLTESSESLVQVPTAAKAGMMSHLKAEFRRWVRLCEAPVEHITQLPGTPALLAQGHQALFQAAFPTGMVAVPCRVDIRVVYSVALSFRCRGGREALAPSAPVASLQGPGVGQLERFASCMIEGMNRMQLTQAKLMECMMGGGACGSVRPQLREPAALSVASSPRPHALMDRSPSFGAGLSDSPGASSVGSPVAIAATPIQIVAAARTEAVSAAPAQAVAATPIQAVETVAATDTQGAATQTKDSTGKPSSSAAVSGVCTLLDLLVDREKKPSVAKRPAAASKTIGAKKRKREKETAEAPPCGKRPSLVSEQSRSQFMCRTGLGGPGSSVRFAYGGGASFPTKAAAKSAANAWLQKELARQGLK